MNTKRFIPVALVAAAGLTIAACGGSSGSTSSTPTSPPATSASPTDQFVTDLASLNDPVINAAPASLIIGLGNGACTDLTNDGGALGPVLADGASVVDSGNTGLTYTEVGEIVGVAVKDLCPQFVGTVQSQLAADGYGTSTS